MASSSQIIQSRVVQESKKITEKLLMWYESVRPCDEGERGAHGEKNVCM